MSAPQKDKVAHDLHELVGQVLNERLRVVQLSYVSPRQWLYEVEPPSVGKTRRALKVLGHPSGREPGSFYRLKTTLDKLKGLEVPQLESVYESGVLHDLTPYLLTEWEPHRSLYEALRLRRQPLSWSEAQPLLIDICKGLKALHSRGVTHGDLRAQHVLLRGELSDALLIDFAVSGAFGAPPASGLEKSLAYWPPERLTFAAATPSTDLYSFGVLAFLCLEGKLPFSPSAPSLEEPYDPQHALRQLHLSQPAPQLTGEHPVGVKLLIERLLSKDPYQRPTSASMVLSILLDPSGADEALEGLISSTSSTSSTSDSGVAQRALTSPPQALTPQAQPPQAQPLQAQEPASAHPTSTSAQPPLSSSPSQLTLWALLSALAVPLAVLAKAWLFSAP